MTTACLHLRGSSPTSFRIARGNAFVASGNWEATVPVRNEQERLITLQWIRKFEEAVAEREARGEPIDWIEKAQREAMKSELAVMRRDVAAYERTRPRA
jgi:hypothetical protein